MKTKDISDIAALKDRKRNDKLNQADAQRDDGSLPGNYPPEEDIMNRSDIERVQLIEDDFSQQVVEKKQEISSEESDIVSNATPSANDVTAEDLQALGPKDLSMDMGEDEDLLKHRVWPVDMAASDLDLPITGDETIEDQGRLEDEENDFYSLGRFDQNAE